MLETHAHEKSASFLAVLDAIAQFRAELYAFGPCYLSKLNDDKQIAREQGAKEEFLFDTLKAEF